MLKKLLLPVLMLTTTAGFGQITFAPEVGVNMSSMALKVVTPVATFNDNSKYQPGVRAGVAMDIALDENFSVQPALYYNLLRTKNEMSALGITSSTNTSVHGLQLPIYFMYKSHEVGAGRFFAGIGPVLSLYLAGNTKSGSISEKMNFGNDPAEDDMKSFDFGGSANIGYELSSGLFLRLYYNYGFANLAPGGDKNYSARSHSLGLSVGYFLGR